MGTLFANIIAIYRKELATYFAAPFSYVIAGVFWLFSGSTFYNILQFRIQETALNDQFGGGGSIDVPYIVLQEFLGALTMLTFFLLPMLSMGLYAEERRRGTLELLATAPITNWVVALGKLMGVVTFFMTMVLPLMIYEAIAFSTADPPLPMNMIVVGHLGLILMGAAVLSVGMFISSLTERTILSAILTFIVVIFLLILDGLANSIAGPVGEALGHLSLLRHYANFVQGIVDTSSIVLFLSYIFLGIFLTAQSVELLRFQRS
ncbi:MAG: ABC transporter permease [Cyanobacteria bacterium P01_F01_bin.150]